MRYLARRSIQNWMVWDRKTHKPATINEKYAVKLSEEEAQKQAAQLNGKLHKGSPEVRRSPIS